MRGVLGRVVDQNQSAFIKGRQITDNILIGFECQHWIRQRKKGLVELFGGRYPKVEISGPSAKGDYEVSEVSVFQFTYEQEHLWAQREQAIYGVAIMQGELNISHIFFANDSLILFKANGVEAQHIKGILMAYELASGQQISFEKSSASFSHNTTEMAETEVLQALNVKAGAGLQRYLGLYAFSLRQKDSNLDILWRRSRKSLLVGISVSSLELEERFF
ncbi:uncharacterized protein LOC130998312 [Salvia miltiorrhiza]|uniref:uncharacterized protein LOC130998312 n=1 Tax=Salvia miltiorrhiza TaxID=226208 RepID=UPI0025AB91B4|nr:uncharacterized protein LOC130998312 [Salvia miltiorrhiza]